MGKTAAIERSDGMSEKEKSLETIQYPSACLLLDSCIRDYERIQENYNKLYEKTNIALAFAGVIFTLFFNLYDLSIPENIEELKLWEIPIVWFGFVYQLRSAVALGGAIVALLSLMRGRKLTVLNSADFRELEVNMQEESCAALWLIDKYTTAVNENRPIIEKKQKIFDIAVVAIISGIILFFLSIILRKVV